MMEKNMHIKTCRTKNRSDLYENIFGNKTRRDLRRSLADQRNLAAAGSDRELSFADLAGNTSGPKDHRQPETEKRYDLQPSEE